jgi:hypothetical protein
MNQAVIFMSTEQAKMGTNPHVLIHQLGCGIFVEKQPVPK